MDSLEPCSAFVFLKWLLLIALLTVGKVAGFSSTYLPFPLLVDTQGRLSLCTSVTHR